MYTRVHSGGVPAYKDRVHVSGLHGVLTVYKHLRQSVLCIRRVQVIYEWVDILACIIPRCWPVEYKENRWRKPIYLTLGCIAVLCGSTDIPYNYKTKYMYLTVFRPESLLRDHFLFNFLESNRQIYILVITIGTEVVTKVAGFRYGFVIWRLA